ncbi:MAG TPA: 16S rRNA (guanine(527)-N(7))-methyltransferase RsmG [Actinomycetales bacterium]|nr:16S rRNA (guanine(527)-N(7))-methyltransferase RsmG [Actinomycetales bacterium]
MQHAASETGLDPAAELIPDPPAVAVGVFGDRLPLVRRYVRHLATTGVEWGLLGPREVPRLWERHVLNCAVLTDLLPPDAEVLDIGSGAGLPGIALALRRPDLRITLVEPLLRRVDWLTMVVADLQLTGVRVRRTRAEDLVGDVRVPHVTARAVASLDRLCRWSLPLLEPGGELLAIKGRSASDEVGRTRSAVRRAGGVRTDIVELAAGLLGDPVTVVRVRVAQDAPADRPRR